MYKKLFKLAAKFKKAMDPRDRAKQGTWYDSFDQKTMTLTVYLYDDDDNEIEADFPAKYSVCSLCDGTGTHVNPGIDAGGISESDFDDDPDFRESYMSGVYDVPCYECNGTRVVPEIESTHFNDKQKELYKLLLKKLEDDAYFDEIRDMERRMGA